MASTLSTTYVNGLYSNLLGFTDPAGTAAWAAQIDLGTSPYNVANAFLDVYQQSGVPVALLYQAAFGRVPDIGGFDYWLNNYRTVSAGDPLLLSQQFYASAEFAARIGGDPTNLTESAYVNALYLNVLGRPGDPSGATYWTDWLTTQEAALGGTDAAKDEARNQLLDVFAMSGENVSEHGKQIETFTVFAGFDNRAPTTAEFTAAETQAELTTVTGVVGASPNFGTTGPAPVPIFALSLAADPASVVEGSASTFTVTTNVPTLAALDYNISVVGDTLGGTAGAASSNDFGTLPTTVKVATGASTATFAITPVADNITEGPEGFKVTLLNGATPVVSTTALITDLVDSTPPVVTAGQVIPYAENLVAGATVGTVAATDNIGVTGFTIASGNDKGYFAIDGSGVVTLTTAGAAAGSAAETSTIQPNQFVLGVTASDAAGNVSTAANVTLNVLDTTAPMATAAAIGASGSSLVMAFNEALATAKLPLPTDFAVVQNGSTAVAVSTVTISGSAVTLGLGSSVSGTVTVSYTPNADPTKDLQDAAGNSVAAITNKSVVVDTIAPTLSGSVPADGATDVAVGANIVLNMSETVKAGTGNILITNTNDPTDNRTISVTDATQVSFSGVAVTINPTADLKTGGAYVVTMSSGVIVDLVGNAFAGISGTNLDFSTPGASGAGQTFALTSAIDTIPGLKGSLGTTDTSGDDLIIGNVDPTAGSLLNTVQVADQVNGGTGINTFKEFLPSSVGTAAILPQLSNVQNIFISGWNNVDLTTIAGLTGVTSLEINKPGATQAYTLNGATQAFTLSEDGNAPGAALFDANLVYGSTNTSAKITVSAVGNLNNAAVNTATIDANGTNLATVNLVSTGNLAGSSNHAASGLLVSTAAANLVTLKDTSGNPSISKITVTGDAKLLLALNTNGDIQADLGKVSTIDASTTNAGVYIVAADITDGKNTTFLPATFAFTGGSGDDVLILASTQLGKLTSGAQLNGQGGMDTLVINEVTADIADAVKGATIYGAINAAKSFEVLGVGVGTGGATIDISKLTTINKFYDAAFGGTVTFANANNSSQFQIDNTVAHTGVEINNAISNAVTTVNLDNQSGVSVTLPYLITNTGISTINLSSTGNTGAKNVITALQMQDSALVNVTGDHNLTLSLSNNTTAGTVGAPTATGYSVDAHLFTGSLTVTGNTAAFSAGSSLGDVLIGGTKGDTLTVGGNSSTLTGNGGNDKFVVTAAVAGNSDPTTATITTITDFTKGDSITLVATSVNFVQTKVDLSASATLTDAINTLASGAADTVRWGQYGGNTYVVDEGAAAAANLAADDVVVKLTGTLDLSTSAIAAGVLTFA